MVPSLAVPTITPLTLGELSTNCYIVSCQRTGQAVIIDPADTGEVIAEELLREQLTPTAIWLTHGHFDHVLGLLPLVLTFDIPVYLHPADGFLLKQAQSSAEHWLGHPVDPVPTEFLPLEPGSTLTVGTLEFEVWHIPGHTPGSCGFFWKSKMEAEKCEQFVFTQPDILFDGDVLFAEDVGRSDFRYSDPAQLQTSIERLQVDAARARVFPGHGEPFMLG